MKKLILLSIILLISLSLAYATNPYGYLDTASETSITGWAYDEDSFSTSIQIRLYFNSNPSSSNPIMKEISANQHRPDVAAVMGSRVGEYHGFSYNPCSFLNQHFSSGQSVTVQAYGVNINAGANTKLTNTKSFVVSSACGHSGTPPPAPQCQQTSSGCCLGNVCQDFNTQCSTGYELQFSGCDSNCNPQLTCVPSTSTPGSTGQPVYLNGNIESTSSEDWFVLTVNSAGEYTIETEKTGTGAAGSGTLGDSVLYLYGPNSDTVLITVNDDINLDQQNYMSRITRDLISQAAYFIKVVGYNGQCVSQGCQSTSKTGTYKLKVTGPSFTLNEGTGITYSCTGTAPSNSDLCSGDDQGLTSNLARKAVSACTSAKCEYRCRSGYHANDAGTDCVADTPSQPPAQPPPQPSQPSPQPEPETPPPAETAGLLTCQIKESCSSNEVNVFQTSSFNNAHASNDNSYPKKVCCSGISGLGTSCSENHAIVATLSSPSNAHVASSGYDVDVCLSAPESYDINCNFRDSCQEDEVCLASASATSNAHVASCDTYPKKICCSAVESAEPEPTCLCSSTDQKQCASCSEARVLIEQQGFTFANYDYCVSSGLNNRLFFSCSNYLFDNDDACMQWSYEAATVGWCDEGDICQNGQCVSATYCQQCNQEGQRICASCGDAAHFAEMQGLSFNLASCQASIGDENDQILECYRGVVNNQPCYFWYRADLSQDRCTGNTHCLGGECVSEPSCSDECSSGGVGCSDADTKWYCSLGSDGCYDKININCAVGETCSGGQCVTSCTDTCSSLGFDCDYQTICGVSTYCGECSSGYTCENGVCVISCSDECSSGGVGCSDADTKWYCSLGSDGCYDKIEVDCAAGETCDNGVCSSIPCTDTCPSLGYECGHQTVCGGDIDCGPVINQCTAQFGTCTVLGIEICDYSGHYSSCSAIDPRVYNCFGRECGSDGCGGNCPPGCDSGYSCDSGQCLPGVCTDTCDSSSYECGLQTVCDAEVNCGDCPAYYTCETTASGSSCVYVGCSNTCESIGYECGLQPVCNEIVSCGYCPINSVCYDGPLPQYTGKCCGFENVCDVTDGCGRTENHPPYNRCDLSYDVPCGTEDGGGTLGDFCGSNCCYDGFDNDCDGLVDGDDPDCPGTCDDTCESLDYVCGVHRICGRLVYCVVCDDGHICSSSGGCISSCLETCDFGGYDCGIHTTCGVPTNCGDCPEGNICNSQGQCIPSTTTPSCTDTCSSIGYQCGFHTVCGFLTDCGACINSMVCADGLCVSLPSGLTPPVTTTQQPPGLNICDGCIRDNVCYPYDYIISNGYCDGDKQWKPFKDVGDACQGNYECVPNFCVNGQCVESGLWEAFISWFRRFFV